MSSKPMKYTSEGVPKNWNGKDWQTYKWALLNVFKEQDLKDIAVGDLTEAMLETASNEKKEDFKKKQLKIMRMIGTSVPPETLQQLRDKETGSEMWTELCNLYEGKQNEAIKAYTIRRVENEMWSLKLTSGGDANLHLCKLFNLKTQLGDLSHNVADNTMVDMLLESLPDQIEFERLKSSIYYGADPSVYTPKRVRELILAAAARQKEFRGKRGDKRGGIKGGSSKGVDEDKDGVQQKTRKARKCFVCGSEQHIRPNCPERAKKLSGANEAEQKAKPRGNCTLRHEIKGPKVHNHIGVDQGVVAGVTAEASREPGEPGEAHGEREVEELEPDREFEPDANATRVEESDQAEEGADSGWWYFDTASNSHVTGNFSEFVSYTEDNDRVQSIRGVTPTLASRIAGVGTVALVTEVAGEQVVTLVDDVLYIPGAEYGLFSPGLAEDQGFTFDLDMATRNFAILKNGRTVAVATRQDATWGFHVANPSERGRMLPEVGALCNYTIADGVGSLTLWHERLCHTCPQYLKTMVDKGLVRGMMLTKRQQSTCDACHLGKQKKKAHRKKLDRALKKPNQVVFADLLFPGKSNATQYEVVLVIMDGFSRFVTVHLLKSKDSPVVNRHMKEYILWAERQAGRHVDDAEYKVLQVLSDKGGEFFNDERA